ncbi:MAG: tRNA (N(6)-L-threonylcarbamoyladenosine(37)-C(2))-methylthiotransferase MtaB [Bacteroidota bacterium]|nr:tRNA (N(6)-L-threonylcarbamoyladenosine(37)-C(2))-methylthiotransferase MtaB [Bacteroidota bacterium]
MKAVSFYTLGCKLNYAETASLERQFVDRGFSVVPFDQQSDVCVVNTCSVTGRADRECRQIIRRALRTSPEAFVIVLGCYAQLAPEEIASIDGVDLVLGASEKFRLFTYTPEEFAEGNFSKLPSPKIFVSPIDEVTDFGIAYSGGVDDRTRAFLKVQDGCDFNCSFCTIPLARGKSRSQAIAASVQQARSLADMGYKEIVLTGVNVGDYGKHDGNSLLALLRSLERVEGIERIRVSSVEPNLLSPQLLEYWLASEKVCKHFHIPLQSGSDRLLRKMRRRYTAAAYASLIQTIKEKNPDAGIGVDVIVGFPGETGEIFEEEYGFLHALPVSYLHVFTYSERPNTPSAEFEGRVEPRVRYSRSEMLRTLGYKKKHAFYATQVGRSLDVLVEGTVEDNMLSGYTDNYVRVRLPYHPSLEHSIARVRLEKVAADACIGSVEDADVLSTALPFLPVVSSEVEQ